MVSQGVSWHKLIPFVLKVHVCIVLVQALQEKKLNVENETSLILDLDETLITRCHINDMPDKIVRTEADKTIGIRLRPYLYEFLENMSKYFEILIFTASSLPYAEAIIGEIDPEGDLIDYIFDRKYCLQTKNGFFIKDLRIIKNRDLKNMVIVDNLVHSFGLQLENGIPILEWKGDKNDTELKHLEIYLIELSKCDNVQTFNRDRLKLAQLTQMNLFPEKEI